MARTITVSGIPDAVYERLQARALAEGKSVSSLISDELSALAPVKAQLTMQEWLDLIETRDLVELPPGAVVEALHAGRAEGY